MHNGSVIDELIESVQTAELHSLAVADHGFTRPATLAQVYAEYLSEAWFKAPQAGVA